MEPGPLDEVAASAAEIALLTIEPLWAMGRDVNPKLSGRVRSGLSMIPRVWSASQAASQSRTRLAAAYRDVTGFDRLRSTYDIDAVCERLGPLAMDGDQAEVIPKVERAARLLVRWVVAGRPTPSVLDEPEAIFADFAMANLLDAKGAARDEAWALLRDDYTAAWGRVPTIADVDLTPSATVRPSPDVDDSLLVAVARQLAEDLEPVVTAATKLGLDRMPSSSTGMVGLPRRIASAPFRVARSVVVGVELLRSGHQRWLHHDVILQYRSATGCDIGLAQAHVDAVSDRVTTFVSGALRTADGRIEPVSLRLFRWFARGRTGDPDLDGPERIFEELEVLRDGAGDPARRHDSEREREISRRYADAWGGLLAAT